MRRGAALVLAASCASMLLAGCAKRPAPVDEAAATRPDSPAPATDATIITHTVGSGETLSRIADNYYGDPGRAGTIARYNGLAGGHDPVPGSTLQLPFEPEEWTGAQRRAAALAPYNRGVQALAQDRVGEAERLFRLALETEPGLHGARYNLALVLLKRGQTETAVAMLEALTDERPDDPEYRCARGNALFQAARFDEAGAQFAQVVAGHPAHRRAAFGLARALQEGGKSAEAAAAWRRYLELDADSGWADTARANLRTLSDGR